ncbi:MAG: TetR/AcrR family transcriptional regulator [Candidatus Omnitrophica bacterium]|nr:TetR/AcrR family transcriptional regulator [Candidatus Omnitrophota bacterium]
MAKGEYSLRQTKYAKTKIALARTFLNRLKSTRFQDIAIRDICGAVEISEGTFYNYFPNKIDLTRYIERLILLKIAWQIQQKEGSLEAVEAIEYGFDLIAREIKRPFLFYEIVSLHTAERARFKKAVLLSQAEKYFAFPECKNIENAKVVTLDALFMSLVIKAQKDGIVSEKYRAADILINLMAIFVGVPLIIQEEEFGGLDKLYRKQLALLWKAVKTDAGKK